MSLRYRVGDLRPSQILMTFGVGSIVDLPNLSVLVMGLDDWRIKDMSNIQEERLLDSVRETLGPQVQALCSPPSLPDSGGFQPNPFDESSLVGVPVAPFPRWMVCPRCRLLAPLRSGLFAFKPPDPYRPERARYVHQHCTTQGKPPTVLPARFLVACKRGHLDDFPWIEFVHRKHPDCANPLLRLHELGASGEAREVEVRCDRCGDARRMLDAFGWENQFNLPACKARRAHLRDHDAEGCDVPHVTAMLQGASNSWFPVSLSAVSIPASADRLEQLVTDAWTTLQNVQSQQNVELLQAVPQLLRDLSAYSAADIWGAILRKRSGAANEAPADLKTPEWKVFSEPDGSESTRDFELKRVDPPADYSSCFEKIVLVQRLREVRALIGFSRIETPGDYENPADFPADQRAPIARGQCTWVPASQIRGEGIFFQFAESEVRNWESIAGRLGETFLEAHRRWRLARGLDPDVGFPGVRFILLHSFAHAVIRQLALECGYTTASIRERIYCRGSDGDGPPMAGVLIYTAAPDSEGTLGGLVSLGSPAQLGAHLDQAFDAMRLCASDPLCAEHHPYQGGITLHAAACHACLFLPETSCERGNKYLDRSVLVKTVEQDELAFFEAL